MIEIICACIAAIAAIVSARATYCAKEEIRKTQERAARRAHESRLAMDLMYATCSLALVTAKKVTGMHTNGDVEEAMETAAEAQKHYQGFARNEAAKNFAKI